MKSGVGRRRRAAAATARPSGSTRRTFRRRLLTWYRRHRRDLPWRRTTDPYKILVSEIMLQQTQVDRVMPKYEEFLTRYPTVESLASARPRDVKRSWYPLGYNIRPVRLHAIARETVERYGGRLPDDPDALLQFKGIGRYTAGAIASFAFGKAVPILDTNVARVLHRVFVAGGAIKKNGAPLWALAGHLVPRDDAYDFNQGLMDLGAVVCTARQPACPRCPMTRICRSYPLNGRSHGHPVTNGRRPVRAAVKRRRVSS